MTAKSRIPINRLKSPISIWLACIFCFLAILWLGVEIIEYQINQRPILFEVFFSGAWVRGSNAGFYIDSEGNISSYTFPKNHFERLVRMNLDWGSPPYTTSDILKKSGYSGHRVGKVDLDTLNSMAALIQPASMGKQSDDDPLTPGVSCKSFDAGVFVYEAYLYDEKLRKYQPVNLYGLGDHPGVNLSPEARTLHQWLKKICIESNLSFGCIDTRLCSP